MPQKFNLDEYVDVDARIDRFWEENPNGAINTEVVFANDFDHVVVLASVYKSLADSRPAATGLAAEERGADYKAGANFTSWHENAETSAIGRALVNMGYATKRHPDGTTTKTPRPSREEMTKVNRGNGGAPGPHTPGGSPGPQPRPVAQAEALDDAVDDPTVEAFVTTDSERAQINRDLHKFVGEVAKNSRFPGESLHQRVRAICALMCPEVVTEDGGEVVPVTSMTQIPTETLGQILIDLAAMKVGKPDQLVLLCENWFRKIEAAKTQGDLDSIAGNFKRIGVKSATHSLLTSAWKERKASLAVPQQEAA